MGAYYYLISQLPHLLYAQKPPMTSSAFMDLVLPLLSEQDADLMKLLSISGEPLSNDGTVLGTGCKFIDDWREWDRALRLNLAKHRSIKCGHDSPISAEPPSVPADAATLAAKAVNSAATPLEGEITIDKARWDAIGTLAGNDYFDRNNVFAYFLKLSLLERRQSFDAVKGLTEYKSLYVSIMENARQIGRPE